MCKQTDTISTSDMNQERFKQKAGQESKVDLQKIDNLYPACSVHQEGICEFQATKRMKISGGFASLICCSIKRQVMKIHFVELPAQVLQVMEILLVEFTSKCFFVHFKSAAMVSPVQPVRSSSRSSMSVKLVLSTCGM